MICADGGRGLIAALPTVYPGIPLQRCWAHKVRNVLGKVRKADHGAVKAALHAIMNAPNRPKALSAARRFASAWEETYPKAVACLRNDLDDLLTCFRYPTLAERRRVRTTNAIERRFREVRRRTRTHGHIPGPHINGPHPLRRLHPRKQSTGSKHPSLPDT